MGPRCLPSSGMPTSQPTESTLNKQPNSPYSKHFYVKDLHDIDRQVHAVAMDMWKGKLEILSLIVTYFQQWIYHVKSPSTID
jgi:hypothetical protein